MMRSSILAFAALAACSRAPVIDLPVCAGGVPIDESAKHAMTIDARGRVTVDGVACANEREVESALGSVRGAMYSDPADVRRSGFLFASDPLIVRIDSATRWVDAARWLPAKESYIYRKWIVVRDEQSNDERCLRIEYLPPPRNFSEPGPLDEAQQAWEPQVQVIIRAVEGTSPSSDVPTSIWRVMHWPDPKHSEESQADSWSAVHDLVVSTPPEQREFAIIGRLRNDLPWSEALPIVADALKLANGQLEIVFARTPSKQQR